MAPRNQRCVPAPPACQVPLPCPARPLAVPACLRSPALTCLPPPMLCLPAGSTTHGARTTSMATTPLLCSLDRDTLIQVLCQCSCRDVLSLSVT